MPPSGRPRRRGGGPGSQNPAQGGPAAQGRTGTAKIYLPGHMERTQVTYQVIGGTAYIEGDIELGTVEEIKKWAHRPALPKAAFERWKKTRKVHGRMAVINREFGLQNLIETRCC